MARYASRLSKEKYQLLIGSSHIWGIISKKSPKGMTDLKKEEKNTCALRTSIGGQALMEGIMMRGPKRTAMAVRNTKGEIVLEQSETRGIKRPKICRLPIIRGIFGYMDSMIVGYKALMRSAEIAGLEDVVEESPKKKKKRLEREAEQKRLSGETAEAVPESVADPNAETKADAPVRAEEDGTKLAEAATDDKLPAWVMTATMVVSIIFGVALAIGMFVWLPTFLFGLLVKGVPKAADTGSDALNSLVKSAFEGVIKVVLLVGYMALISLEKDIRRTFMYHGAEHKSIFCYEAGKELTVENVRSMRRFHPRCGTSFLILMVLVSIFISFFIDPVTIVISGHVLSPVWRVLVRILLIPLVVGIGYELIKFAGRHDNIVTRVISAPGLWLQRITVREPDDSMIECAITALKAVIPEDGSDRI